MRGFLPIAALAVSLAGPASANCGLSFCPMRAHGEEKAADWALSAQAQETGFDFDGVSGAYTQLLPRAEYHAVQDTILGAVLPVTRLTSGGESHTGLANALVFGERKLAVLPEWRPSVGLQAELPTGDHEHGIASDHTMLVPYLTVARSLTGEAFFQGSVGYRHAFGGHDEDAAHPLLVNPHADKEFLYRAGVGTHFRDDSLMTQLYVDGQQVLSDDSDDKTFVTGGLQAVKKLSSDMDLTALLELPLTTPSRYDWRVGLGLTYRR